MSLEIYEPTRSQYKRLLKVKPWLKYFDGIDDPWTIGNLLIGEYDLKHFAETFHEFDMSAIHHREMINAFSNPILRRVFAKVPRGHGKSTIGEINIKHNMVYQPKKYCVVGAVTKDQVTERTETIRDLFDDTYPFYYLSQDGKQDWAKTNFVTKNGSKCRAVSSGGQIAGAKKKKERPSLFWGDDLVPNVVRNIKDYQINNWFFNDILNILSGVEGEKTDKVIVTGTPYRETDLTEELRDKWATFDEDGTGKILEFEVFNGLDLPALWVDDTKVLWDHKFPLAELRRKYKEFGSLVFTRNYLCRHVSGEMSLFPPHVISNKDNPALYEGLNFSYRRPSYIKKVVGAADLALDPRGDYFVLGAFGIHRGTPLRWELLHLERYRGWDYLKQVQAIARVHNMFKFNTLVIETNAFQRVISQLTKHLTTVPVKDHNTTFLKNDLLIGIPRLRTHFENGRWVIPYGGQEEKRIVDALYHELTGTFIAEDGKVEHNTKNNDLLMFMYLAMQGLEKLKPLVQLAGGI